MDNNFFTEEAVKILIYVPLLSAAMWTISSLSRLVKMKRPVIFQRCELHSSNLQCVQQQKEILTSRLPESSLSGGSMGTDWEDTWRKRQNLIQLYSFLGNSSHMFDILIAVFNCTLVLW